jgi:hypothetical protein
LFEEGNLARGEDPAGAAEEKAFPLTWKKKSKMADCFY